MLHLDVAPRDKGNHCELRVSLYRDLSEPAPAKGAGWDWS